MNKERRKKLTDLFERVEAIKDEVEELSADEWDAFNALPENLQGSERGEQMENISNDLDEAFGLLEDVLEYLENALSE